LYHPDQMLQSKILQYLRVKQDAEQKMGKPKTIIKE